jgi:beta-glucosidase
MTIFLIIALATVALYVIVLFWFRDSNTNLKIDIDKLKRTNLKLDKNFLWGSSTSSHQVEGYCTNNNWYQFESAVDKDGKPKILNGQKAGLACDQWNRYKEDIQLMKALSLNSYRFSVEWSKIEPAEGKFSDSALTHYEQVIDELLTNNIEPMLTLHHFTNPIWFEEKGAFLQENSPETFARFVEKVTLRLGQKIKLWVTINEPSVYAINGYFKGDFPPGEKDPQKAAKVMLNVLRAHTEAYSVIKKIRPDAQVGLAIAVFLFDPPSQLNLLDLLVAHLANKNFNESILRYLKEGYFYLHFPFLAQEEYKSPIQESFDFVGLNYYTRYFARLNPLGDVKLVEHHKSPVSELTDMHWEIYPEGLYRALKIIQSYTHMTIYITENGIADSSDTKRSKYIEDHLLVMAKAISEGVNIGGYFYWSLLDNFEWAFGYERRFGLYKVDFKTQERTLRNGGAVYPEMIQRFKE